MLPLKNMNVCNKASARSRSTARATPRASTPVAPAHSSSAAVRDAQHIEAQVAFSASLEKVIGANRGSSVHPRDHVVAQLALQSSSAARLQRQTHLNTLNMSSMEEEAGAAQQQQAALPLSQLAFKALLRASLAAARLHHGYLTTPHLLLGLISAGSTSLAPTTTNTAAADGSSSSSSGSLAAAAEAAVVQLVDGPTAAQGQLAARGAAAAASLLGRSRGLAVVQWVPQLSDPAKEVLLLAEQWRQEQGHKLLTTHHLLAVLLNSHLGGDSSSSSSRQLVVQQLLQELGFDVAQVAAAAVSGVSGGAAGAQVAPSSSSSSSSADTEDELLAEPLGFLHEEFYSSLCAELVPAATHSGSPCLN